MLQARFEVETSPAVEQALLETRRPSTTDQSAETALSTADLTALAAQMLAKQTMPPEDGPGHDWHQEALARRKAKPRQHPASGLTGAEVKCRVRRR